MPKGIVKCGNCKGLEYPVAIPISKNENITNNGGGYTVDNTLYLYKGNNIRLQYSDNGGDIFGTDAVPWPLMTFKTELPGYSNNRGSSLYLEEDKLIYYPTSQYKVKIEIDSTSGWTFDSTQGFIRALGGVE